MPNTRSQTRSFTTIIGTFRAHETPMNPLKSIYPPYVRVHC